MEDWETVRDALTANRANTLALLGCMRETLEEKPFREAEAAMEGSRDLALSTQGPHALYAILMKCGAVEAIAVPESADDAPAGDDSTPMPAAAAADGTASGESSDDEEAPTAAAADALPDQPVDYRLRTTEAGRAALAAFEPAKRFEALMAAEPEGYGDAYARVLDVCADGASKGAIEEALANHPALAFPKPIYPGYFISKLETIDGISWDGAWRTTEAGRRMRALLA